MSETAIVPFGKYKGAPVEVLVADRDYCDWLASQSWFRERYPSINQLVINYGGQPQDTPEHNVFQASFLDERWRLALVGYLRPGLFSVEAAHQLAERHDSKVLERATPFVEHVDEPVRVFQPEFEVSGWDVEFTAAQMTCHYNVISMPKCSCICLHADCDESAVCKGHTDRADDLRVKCKHTGHAEQRAKKQWSTEYGHCSKECVYVADRELVRWLGDEGEGHYDPLWVTFKVELKPTLGDDYPSVLRQVKRYRADHDDVRCVLVRNAAFEGVTWEQVAAVFRLSNISLVHVDQLNVSRFASAGISDPAHEPNPRSAEAF